MTEVTTLMIPKDLAEEIKKIAAKEFPPRKWTYTARTVLWGWVAMHRARGNV